MKTDPFLQDLIQSFTDSVDCQSASLFLIDEQRNQLMLAAAVGYPADLVGQPMYQVGEGLTGWVAQTGKILNLKSAQEAASHPYWLGKYDSLQWSNPLFKGVMAVPLIGKLGEVLGVLKAENKKEGQAGFTEADLVEIESFARTAIIALQLRKTNEQLRRFIYAFVLMPFSEQFDDIYRFGIKRPIESLGITCERVDEIQYTGGVLEQVFKGIERARFVVADMTGRNANVFYEVGYCHAIKKDVILCTQSAEDIPFDLRGYNHIVYDGKIAVLEEALLKRVLALTQDDLNET